MKASVDEDEHSLEMHLPYIRHIFKEYVLHIYGSIDMDILQDAGVDRGCSRRPMFCTSISIQG